MFLFFIILLNVKSTGFLHNIYDTYNFGILGVQLLLVVLKCFICIESPKLRVYKWNQMALSYTSVIQG